MKLDRAERQILHVLQLEGRISNVDLAERVGLSESPCFRRVKRLEDCGLIASYGAKIDNSALGLQVTAFVQITLEKHDDHKREAFLDCVKAEAHIVECHVMSGSYDFLLKVVAYSMDHFSKLSMQRILKFPGVSNMESHFSLMAIKRDAPLPVTAAGELA